MALNKFQNKMKIQTITVIQKEQHYNKNKRTKQAILLIRTQQMNNYSSE